jgi:hypothetical protein
MLKTSPLSAWIVSVVAGLMVLGMGALASDARAAETVDGVTIYLGVVPAAVVRGHHPPDHPEAEMHGGVPDDGYHVMIALFDDKTGNRITDADVEATISGEEMAEVRKDLERMVIADAETYGNYFDLTGSGPYDIDLKIRLPDDDREVRATLDWQRP